MMRVAFLLIGGSNWTGGRNYLVNLLGLLAQYEASTTSPVLFVGTDVDQAELQPLRALDGVEIIFSSAFDRVRSWRSMCSALTLGSDIAITGQFKEARIDVVFESARYFGWRIGLPTLAWIPDFQHRHLKRLFGFSAYWKRELGFLAQVHSNRTVVLSSQNAQADCHKFYPSTVGRTSVVRFSVPASPTIDEVSAKRIASTYGLPERFYYLPNQFWVHKNHGVVVSALALLQAEGIRMTVAVSGQQHDPRDPLYFPALQRAIAASGVSDRFILLGLIPSEHVRALMIAADALLNPSKFEGWSTTVEEARANGVPLILSDIGVHREQAQDQAVYFNPSNSTELAVLLKHYKPLSVEERRQRRSRAATEATARVAGFAKDFVGAVRTCWDLQPRLR
jgi:glycosyltransferase involved in cell wall biosynthesis